VEFVEKAFSSAGESTKMMRAFFGEIPRDLEECRMVDGCGRMDVSFSMYLLLLTVKQRMLRDGVCKMAEEEIAPRGCLNFWHADRPGA